MTLHSPDTLTPSPSSPTDAQDGVSRPSAPPPDPAERARVLELRSEAQSTQDKAQRAALLFEAGFATETTLHQAAHAVQDYLAAYNSDARSRLPLHALLRMFERRSSYKNLARLYDAALRSAHTPHEKASALMDIACLDLVHGGDAQAATARLTRALESDVAGEAALLLEWDRRAANDAEGALHALEARVQSCDDPTQRGVLLLELAAHREQAGDPRGALAALRSAALDTPRQELFLVALTRLARQHGFTAELVEASERRAELIGNELSERMVDAEPDQALLELLRARAVALWYEAARLRCTSLSDPQGALSCLDKALTLRPDHLLLRKMRMLAFDLLEDRQRAAQEARALLEMGAEGEDAAALHFRLAEHALVSGDAQQAREGLMQAIASAPESMAAEAILDDLLLDEGLGLLRIERRVARAASAPPERAHAWLLEAAQIAAFDLTDAARALQLFTQAEQALPGQEQTARLAYAAALTTRDAALTSFALSAMSTLRLDAQERSAILHHVYETTSDDEAARAHLSTALEASPERAPLANLARSRGAAAHDFTLLAQAHELLAEQSTRDDEMLAHLCAAARASVRAGDLERSRALLERALTRDAAHPYAVSLLEEVLRRSQHDEALIELLKRTAESQKTGEQAEAALLGAGLTAERDGDLSRAQQLFAQAAEKAPTSSSPWWCLLQLAERTGDAALLRRAQGSLAQLELTRGSPGIDTLLACELAIAQGSPRADTLEQLEQLLDNPKVAAHAALSLLLLADAPEELQERALEVLAAHASEPQRGLVQRALLSNALLTGQPHARLLDMSDEVLSKLPRDGWALFVKSCVPLPHDEEGHAATLLALAELTTDARLKESLAAEALWSQRMVRRGALDAELRGLVNVESGVELARVLRDTQSPGEEPAIRAAAVERLLSRAEGEEQHELLLELARCDLARGEPQLALERLEQLLAGAPADASALELKRVAARAAGEYGALVEAAEALAAQLEEQELALTLLEESAMVRADELSDEAGAQHLFTLVLARDPTRVVAYDRLHELLRGKADTSDLIDLVRTRTEHVHDAEELVKLFYELARLHRARGALDEALEAIDNVLMLEDHVGALALSAEIHTSREEWDEAVRALEAMASAPGVPKAQRRLCRLAAADFLEHRLSSAERALEQLQKLRDEGHDDLALQLRVADVAERAGAFEQAVAALERATSGAAASERVKLLLRIAQLSERHLQQPAQALDSLRRVLMLDPLHDGALRDLHRLQPQPQQLATFERALRSALADAPLDPAGLRKLSTWSELAGDRDGDFIALMGLSALGEADETERQRCDALLKSGPLPRVKSAARLTSEELTSLFGSALLPAYANLLRNLFSAASEIDQLDPSKFGVGRGQRIVARDASALRDELEAMCAPLGLSLLELYQGGNELARVAAIPREEGVVLVVGPGVTAPLGASRRQQLALQLAACQQQALPLLSRSPGQAMRLIWAALVAAECVGSPPSADLELGELPRTLSKVLPRKVRKTLPERFRTLPDQGRDMARQAALLSLQARQLALLLAGDLQASLDEAIGGMASGDSIAASDTARDLMRTWTSGPMAQLRKKLGLAK